MIATVTEFFKLYQLEDCIINLSQFITRAKFFGVFGKIIAEKLL
jgi:hypothetical protein